MRVLGFWIACGLALAIGYGGGAGSSDLGIVLVSIAVASGGLAAGLASSAPHRGRRWLALAVLALLSGRGVLAAAHDDPGRWRGPRGLARGLRTFVVEGASHPGPRCRVRVRSADRALWLAAPAEACPLAAGQRIRVLAARLERAEHPELPGDPSVLAMARSHGAVAPARVDRLWPAGGEPDPYWRWVARQRQRAWVLSRGDRSVSFVVAASLGVRSALCPAARSALRRAGLGHLIAVSGLHVGLAAWVLLALAMRVGARLGGGAAWGVLLSWVPLVGYVVLTGASPPAVRAGIMAVGVGLGGLWGRPHHGPVLLAATSVAMLVVRPAWAFDPGFQLSVAAMAALVRAPGGEGMLRQTWRVTWVVLPLSLGHFGHGGVFGVLCNLMAIPVFTLWVLPLGLLGWLAVPWLGVDALRPAGWGAQPILELAQFVAGWPSPPVAWIGAVAGVAVVVGVLGGRRDPTGALRRGAQWLPPVPVALAVVVVIAWPRTSSAPVGRWWVVGRPRAPAVVTVAAEPGRSIACVHAVAVAPSRWRTLLDAMGVDAAGLVAVEPRAPHQQALRQALRAQRRWVERPSGCPPAPPPALARWVLTQCRRRAGTHYGMAVVGDRGVHCFMHGRWREPWPLPPEAVGDLLDSTPPSLPSSVRSP